MEIILKHAGFSGYPDAVVGVDANRRIPGKWPVARKRSRTWEMVLTEASKENYPGMLSNMTGRTILDGNIHKP